MKFNPFKKSDKDKEKTKDSLKITEQAEMAREKIGEKTNSISSISFSGAFGQNTHKILKSFYISEKSSLGQTMNQYTFKVADSANKSEVKKEVANLFNVKVKGVKMVKMPRKRRDFGRHSGFKPGYKKAVAVLKEGYTIGQAKP